jgi:hypothetical protein
MAVARTTQKRVGKNENAILKGVLKIVRDHKVYSQDKTKRETFFNHRLYRSVKDVYEETNNIKIAPANLVGETFRPEFFIQGRPRSSPLLCAECKKLTDKFAKARFKEGLSQALLYASVYKAVLLVFYDYTKRAKYSAAFSKSDSTEARLAAELLEKHRIHMIFLRHVA